MTTPTERNRLDEEESPYLRQHADNPVNWQPWDEAALAAAREHDVPIFLSIGYSACHWCHVMEEESFEDDEIAAVLNEHFVPIKVDREERPDLDSVYMTVAQAVTGRGGWPLSVFLTPDGEPFYVGTYFPKEPTRGMPGFGDVLAGIREKWGDPESREQLEDRADQWTSVAKSRLEETGDERTDPDPGVLEDAADATLNGVDFQYGGFGRSGPKFPQNGRLHALLRGHERYGRESYLQAVETTLDAMVDGGLYDHVGGGFHRYCTDRDWTVPHFEKMLYDNAEIPRVLLAGYQAIGTDRYADVVDETVVFLERELRHPEGGFYSTLDARSEGEEGTFYVWTPEQVHAAVADATTAELLCDRFGITEAGNFEGATVLTIDASVSELVAEYDLDEDAVRERLADGTSALFDARSERPRPARDEKVLAGWNGLAVSMLAAASRILGPKADGDGRYATLAAEALAFVREHLWDAETRRLARRYKDGDVKGDGYLEDYAFLARGAADLYQATGAVEQLAFALDLGRVIVAEFYDEERETLYFTPESGESLVTRPQELRDQSTPSSLGVAVDTLLTLDHFSPDDQFADVAETVVERHAARVASSPTEYPSLVQAADRLQRGDLELTVAAADLPESWRATLAERYRPDLLVSVRPPTEAGLQEWLDVLDLAEAPPIWADRRARDDDPTVYACRSFTCSPPEHDVEAALAWADENAG